MRPLAGMLALLLALTPVTQALAQAKQGPSAPEAETSSQPRIIPAPSGPTLRVPAVTANTAPLLSPRPVGEATDEDGGWWSDLSTAQKVVTIVGGLVVVGALIFYAVCEARDCFSFQIPWSG